SSADGTKLAAVVFNYNAIYTSADSGMNWFAHAVPNNYWYSVASSADGSKLVAVARGGGIFTSGDSGNTWVSNNVPSESWYSVASSTNGANLLAAGINCVYTTTNAGLTWVSNSVPMPLAEWAASSADGSRLYLAGQTAPSVGGLYAMLPASAAIPMLNIKPSGANLVIAWPNSAPGFQLQQNVDLRSSNWSTVSNGVVNTNSTYQVTISTSNSAAYYRLIGP
ncbi:MAG TPA: hypothetical protein VH251_10735, partial [Verrucomicrobiae bacterium]|nr:hypothetical protein [Verrucomicrobiae bacterium]